MTPKFILLLMVASLSGCAQRGPMMTTDNQRIIAAILAQLPDEQSSYEKFVKEYPDADGYLGRMVDHRLCVARQVAGAPGELVRDDENQNTAPDPSKASKRWEESKTRTSIPTTNLPKHLRWDGPFSYCPSGNIRLGTPEIAGDAARVFIENRCSGWCGWGGTVLLKRTNGIWRVTEHVDWWAA